MHLLVASLWPEQIQHILRHFFKFFISIFLWKFFYNNDILLIYRSYKIAGFASEKIPHIVKSRTVFFVGCLNNKDNTFHFRVNM